MKRNDITNEEKQIIDALKEDLYIDAPHITQERFDALVDYIMLNEENRANPKELLWRLCGCYEGYNFNKVIDIFVDSKDYYYTSELVSYVDGNLDQEYLVNKMIATNDLDFIDKTIRSCGNAITYSLKKEYIDKLLNFCNKN